MPEINFNPFPVLYTERLILRQVHEDDADDLFRMRSDREIMRFIPRPLATKREDALTLIRTMNYEGAKNNSINWAMSFKDQQGLIGIIGYPRVSKEGRRGEIGYLLDKAHQGKGIMHEALVAVLSYGFLQAGFHTIEAVIDPDNIASEKLLLKNGFVKEAHFRENLYFEGRWLDSVHYTLFSSH
jgi:ribosomal-protein-alanine N-acetyltransferase